MLADRFRLDGRVAVVTGKVFEIDGGLEAPNLALNLPDL